MTPEEIAWISGLYEGEGSAFLVVRTPWLPGCRMVVYMTDEDVVRRFADTVGIGKFTPATYRRKYSQALGHKPQACWMISSWKDFLTMKELMWPWLGERRKHQIERVLEHRPDFPNGTNHCSDDPAKPFTGGYYRHKRLKEEPCANCLGSLRTYHATYQRDWRAVNGRSDTKKGKAQRLVTSRPFLIRSH